MAKLFLIDGHALVFKMYYAFLRRPMINTKGVDTSILYGFTKYLLELIGREQPDYLAVAFDPPGGSFRNTLYPEYKGTRPPTPELVKEALEPLSAIVRSLNIPVLMMSGFEADDVIGSAAAQLNGSSLDVYMVTPDKDYGQLIGPHVFQYKPGKSGGEDEILGEKELCEKWGISSPSQVVDMLAICGDTADNVPGVKGVGEVGAAKLIARYGSLESIYGHLSELSPRQQEQFAEARPHMELSKTLVTIKTDIELPVALEQMRLDSNYGADAAALFELYEFASLRRYLGAAAKAAVQASAPAEAFEPTEATLDAVSRAAHAEGRLSIVAEAASEGVFAKLERLTLGSRDLWCVLPADEIGKARPILENASVKKAGADLKRQSSWLKGAGIALEGCWEDVVLMHYLKDPERSHDVTQLCHTLLGIQLEQDSAEPAPSLSLFDDVPEEEPVRSRGREACALCRLAAKLREDLPQLYDSMEEPLSKVLADMERDGVKVDLQVIRSFTEGLRSEVLERERHIREMVNEPELNISSPKQIGELLFDRLALDPKAKKSVSKGQYTTDESTLLEIADRHPVVSEILEFRAVKKLLSTYIEPFPGYISPVDGRIHTTFNQALTATGRLSSSNPNLQNIPVRTERGKEIRKAFIPGTPEGLIVSADYSQIELRIMAHLSGDEHLLQAFRDGVDVHASTAAKIFGIPVEEVTREQRGMAKTANFGIMYGISAFGLAERLHLSRKEAKALIDGYFESFPAIRSFIEGAIAQAREKGYVQTLLGRRRYLPDINAHNANVRAVAERNAVNAPIQGTSADIIKLAMTGVAQRLREEGLRSRMVLQIHDELLFDALPSEVERVEQIAVEVMENVVKLSVPLTVECSHGKNWLEAH